jgi:hypothetical protein
MGCKGVRAQGPALVSIRDSAPLFSKPSAGWERVGPGRPAYRVPYRYQQGVAADLQKQAPDAVDS